MINCPKCNASNFKVLYSTNDLVYRPIIIKDGKVVNTDLSESGVKYMCECLECNEHFTHEGSLIDNNDKVLL